jgi:hypothetical protein
MEPHAPDASAARRGPEALVSLTAYHSGTHWRPGSGIMSKRLLISLAGAVIAVVTASVMVTAQRAAAPPLVVTAYNDGPPIPYTAPRTPWGDPDLQGVWSSDDTSGLPRERPKELGNSLYLSDQAFQARKKQVEQGITRGENDIGSFRNDFARRAFRQTSVPR